MERRINTTDIIHPSYSYRTTGQFEKLSRSGFKRHCSPTAISNLILSLRPELDPNEVFSKVAKIGTSHLIYWNMDLFKTYGGTSDFLTGIYIRLALKAFGITDRKVIFRGLVRAAKIKEAFHRGSILLLAMHNHPKYKNHHVLCYGIENNAEGHPCLLIADGWAPGKTLMPYKELHLTFFFEISERK